jgi:hypothetical protein
MSYEEAKKLGPRPKWLGSGQGTAEQRATPELTQCLSSWRCGRRGHVHL